jgi:hypothetical protein
VLCHHLFFISCWYRDARYIFSSFSPLEYIKNLCEEMLDIFESVDTRRCHQVSQMHTSTLSSFILPIFFHLQLEWAADAPSLRSTCFLPALCVCVFVCVCVRAY